MATFLDVVCPACRKRFGWCGEVGDVVDCPQCATPFTLGNDVAEVERYREHLRVRRQVREEGRKLNAAERERFGAYIQGKS